MSATDRDAWRTYAVALTERILGSEYEVKGRAPTLTEEIDAVIEMADRLLEAEKRVEARSKA